MKLARGNFNLKRITGIIISAAGLVLLCISLFADQIGFGDVDPDHFVIGSKQITGIVIGILVFLTGIFIVIRKKK